jgi:transposase
MKDNKGIIEKIQRILPMLNEAQKRVYLASEYQYIDRGSKTFFLKELGVSYNTIKSGIKDLELKQELSLKSNLRKKGGGRKPKINDEIWKEIECFIEPHRRGEPQSPLEWTSQSLRNIEAALGRTGVNISHRVIGEALKSRGFSLQGNKKTFEGKGHKDRDAQFEYIAQKVSEFQSENQPVISVDAKKKELVGNYKNNGKIWSSKGKPTEVNAYDFLSDAEGVAIPYGIYDQTNNKGWVNVGITKDTAEFAVQSIRNWWYKMGIYHNNKATSLLITADGGGSNSTKGKLWKIEIQKLANETGLDITVLHFPPGTSKWNKIEHRLFSYISKNWAGKPLISYEVIVNLISSTRTKTGLEVDCEMDTNQYKTGIKISDEQMRELNIERSLFHGEWNYTISPI